MNTLLAYVLAAIFFIAIAALVISGLAEAKKKSYRYFEDADE